MQQQKKLTRILSLDGGGIRGILPGQILVSLEKKLQQKTNNSNARLAHYFDFIAGTSTGGILTCAYLCPNEEDATMPKFTAQEAVNLYLLKGGNIFQTNVFQKIKSVSGLSDEKYSAKDLEESLHTYFGSKRLSQLLKPCIITSYNIFSRTTHFFTQHDAVQKEGYDYYLHEVARATAAAPTYFEPALVHSMSGVSYPLIDGGIFANNPGMVAYAEARQLFDSPAKPSGKVTAADMFMLSIGTGTVKKPYDYKKAKNWGAIGWASPIIDMMMSGVSETVDFQLGKLFDADGAAQNYIRLTPELGTAHSEMDNATPENLLALKEAGIAAAEKFDDELNVVADVLIAGESNRSLA
ncbi:MAG: patatin-like phospholipase family protein [Bacteroidetes bacterium]|nr:patatin-like phospholipase family protein [Bacteroidota bacterium]